MSRIPTTGALKSAGKRPGKRMGAALLAAATLVGGGLPALAADADSAPTRDMSVQEAWANAREDWRQLQAASDEAWGQARREFQDSWSRVQELMSERAGAAPAEDGAGPDREAD